MTLNWGTRCGHRDTNGDINDANIEGGSTAYGELNINRISMA